MSDTPMASASPTRYVGPRKLEVPKTPDDKGLAAIGLPSDGKPLSARAAINDQDRVITPKELQEVWGMDITQLRGLNAFGVVWEDGLNEAELDKMLAQKQVMFERFSNIFLGSGKLPEEVEIMFDRLYELAVQGKLDLEAWNEVMVHGVRVNGVMVAGGLPEFKMNQVSFAALMGGKTGGDAKDVVEGYIEFNTAIYSLTRTLQMEVPPSDERQLDETTETDLERFRQYSKKFEELCASRNFQIISMDRLNEVVINSLRIKAESQAFKSDPENAGYNIDERMEKGLLLEDIREGKFGTEMQKWLEELKIDNWNEFVMMLALVMNRGIESDANKETMDGTQAALKGNRNKVKIWKRIEEGAAGSRPAAYTALCAELEGIWSKGMKELHADRVKGKKAPKPVREGTIHE